MLNRYIGNKKQVMSSVAEAIADYASPGDLVCDAFSGTLAVSLALKQRGYRVASNDINLLSAMYGAAFLTNDGVADVNLDDLLPPRLAEASRVSALTTLTATPEATLDLIEPEDHARFSRLATLIGYLDAASVDSLPARYRRSDIFDNYCEEGRRSAYVSGRGRTGRRRFFTADNASRIDAVLNHLRYWHDSGALSHTARAVLTCQLMDAVERVSNTQGTYHDFLRADYDPRAFGRLTLEFPDYRGLLGNRGPHILGVARDSLEFVREVPPHRVLYLDPPYNFRQYTAYYFLPNAISRYAEIPDLDDYFGAIQFVRGQNMADDFCSPFSRRTQFITAMRELIRRADTEKVVVSYFNGSNHWRDFKLSSAPGTGALPLEELMTGDMFVPGSFEVRPTRRLNYQSYGGYSAKYVDELLLIATKKKGGPDSHDSDDRSRLAADPGRAAVLPVAG